MEEDEGVRQLMSACKRLGEDTCKHGFPKLQLMFNVFTVICHGLGKLLGLKTAGDRSVPGKMYPPRNSPDLAETTNILARLLRTNTHVLDTACAPPGPLCHSAKCKDPACKWGKGDAASLAELVAATDKAQCAQCGYLPGAI